MGKSHNPEILLKAEPKRGVDLGNAIRWGAKERGISALRLTIDLWRRARNHQTLTPQAYFSFGLQRKEMTEAQRAAFIGDAAGLALNQALGPPARMGFDGLVRNKALTAMVLERAGLATTRIRAVFAADGHSGPWLQLRTLQQVEDYLLAGAELPMFGKPVNGSRSLGIASIMVRNGADQVVLGDGRSVDVRQLAQEIAQTYPDGYLFMELLRPHPELELLSGPAIASLRVVSLWSAGRAQVLYTTMKLPRPGAMADDISHGLGNVALCLDPKTGRIDRAQSDKSLGIGAHDVAPITGVPLLGKMVPDWAEAIALAGKAHALFSQHGLLGFDIVLSDHGPVVNEINANPMHGPYQRSSGRGFLNPEIRPLLVASLAERGVTRRAKGMPLP